MEATQKSVEGIKEFTVDEIQSQLKPIKDRISQKESTLASYGTLLTRSQGIYQEAPIEEEKKEVHKPEENNKDDEEQDLDLDLPWFIFHNLMCGNLSYVVLFKSIKNYERYFHFNFLKR